MAPPAKYFDAHVLPDSAVFSIRLPDQPEWRWNDAANTSRADAEYFLEFQWDTTRADSQTSPRANKYEEAVAVVLTGVGTLRRGSLEQLVREADVCVIARRPDSHVGFVPVLDRSIHVTVDGSQVRFVVMPSPRLTRLRRAHPESTYVTVILQPLGVRYNRWVRVSYRRTGA